MQTSNLGPGPHSASNPLSHPVTQPPSSTLPGPGRACRVRDRDVRVGEELSEGSLWGPSHQPPPLGHGESHEGRLTLRNSGCNEGTGSHQSDTLAHPRPPAASPPRGYSRPSAVGSKAHRPVSMSPTHVHVRECVCARDECILHVCSCLQMWHVYTGDHGHQRAVAVRAQARLTP